MRTLSRMLPLVLAVLAACTDAPTAPNAGRPEFGTARSAFKDADANGIPDVGEVVTGKYESVYAYDASGNWYWDLGDGRVQGSVTGIAALDPSTLTRCDYQVQYRGKFENNPYQDTGWIANHINCAGYDDNASYTYLIVHKTDPRYRGNPEWKVWGTWEYHVLTVSGYGNLVRPYSAVGVN